MTPSLPPSASAASANQIDDDLPDLCRQLDLVEHCTLLARVDHQLPDNFGGSPRDRIDSSYEQLLALRELAMTERPSNYVCARTVSKGPHLGGNCRQGRCQRGQ